ncbi:hypothetical protein [Azohydromonas aeria]|uniref:hypothetical protein n=1 Tax=Azohydromonas aeria TaxID=2590212 RepID=UPI0012F74756|nr:hypothetical protein [Azohydromonas aeria]
MKKLAVGERATFEVDARRMFNESGIQVESGAVYRLAVSQQIEAWDDASVHSSPRHGWSMPWSLIEPLVRLRARASNVPMYALVGAVDEDPSTYFHALAEQDWTPSRNGQFTCFANDWARKYDNNKGRLLLEMTRVA